MVTRDKTRKSTVSFPQSSVAAAVGWKHLVQPGYKGVAMHGNPWLLWLGAAIVLALIEAVTVDFVFLMLAAGALAGCLAAGLGAGFEVSAMVAIGAALLGLGVVRPPLRRAVGKSQRDNRDIGVHAVVGSIVHVRQRTDGSAGLVRIAGDDWTARTTSGAILEAGEDARVVEIRGATAIVEPIAPYSDVQGGHALR